jgi:hypothetical protein
MRGNPFQIAMRIVVQCTLNGKLMKQEHIPIMGCTLISTYVVIKFVGILILSIFIPCFSLT